MTYHIRVAMQSEQSLPSPAANPLPAARTPRLSSRSGGIPTVVVLRVTNEPHSTVALSLSCTLLAAELHHQYYRKHHPFSISFAVISCFCVILIHLLSNDFTLRTSPPQCECWSLPLVMATGTVAGTVVRRAVVLEEMGTSMSNRNQSLVVLGRF